MVQRLGSVRARSLTLALVAALSVAAPVRAGEAVRSRTMAATPSARRWSSCPTTREPTIPTIARPWSAD